MLQFFRKKEEGFTLIELLIVVIILGILAVVAIPRFMNNRTQAQANACRTNMRMINDAIGRHTFDLSAAPATINALVTTNYLQSLPICPGFGNVAGANYGLSSTTGLSECTTSGAATAATNPHAI